jgi:hypothetical protein
MFARVICIFKTPLSSVFTKMPFLTVIMYKIVFNLPLTIDIEYWQYFSQIHNVGLISVLTQMSRFAPSLICDIDFQGATLTFNPFNKICIGLRFNK